MPFLRGDIASAGQNAECRAGGIRKYAGVEADGNLSAVARDQDQFVADDSLFSQGLLNSGASQLRLGKIFRESGVDQVLARVARQPGSLLVYVGNRAVRRDGEQRVG